MASIQNSTFIGAVYAPTLNRIYFMPFGRDINQGDKWIYLDEGDNIPVSKNLMASSMFNR